MQNLKESQGSGSVDNTPTTGGIKPLWPLGIFLFLSAASTWTVWLWPLKMQGHLILFVLEWEIKIPFLLMKLVIGNCLPGILAVIWVLFEGKGQFRRMLATLTKWRTPLKWYIVAVALPSAVFLAALDAVLFYFPMDHSFPPTIGFFNVFLMTLPLGPLWEELAWRAFALRKLDSRYSHPVSALLLGVYWAVWHIPLWLVMLNLNQVNRIPVLLAAFVNLIAWSIIWAYLYHCSSESLPVVILLHATYAAVQNQVAAAVPYLHPQLIYVSAVLSVCLAVAFSRALRRMPRA